jgi:pilus assembly protein TadC
VVGYVLSSFDVSQFNFHVFVSVGITVSLIAPSTILIFQERRRNEIDRNLPRVLEDISEGIRAGMTPIEAIEETSKLQYGWISKELKILVAQISWGVPIVEAFEHFSRRIGTEMSKKTITFLLAALRLGGDLKTVLTSTARFLHTMLEAEDERKKELQPYLPIIYVTLIVFLVTMIILYSSLSSLFELQSPILQLYLTKEDLKILLFDLSIMEAIFGGLIASKLSQGSIYPGLKHAIVMLVVNTATFLYFF